MPELLAGSAEGGAAENILEAGRRAEDVEVTLVEHDAAGQAAVGVDAHAEHQAARVRFLDADENILDGVVRIERVVQHGDFGSTAALGRCLEDAEPLEVVLGLFQVGIGENLPRIEGHLAKDDVLHGAVVADDEDLPDMGRRLLNHLIVHVDDSRLVRGEDRHGRRAVFHAHNSRCNP